MYEKEIFPDVQVNGVSLIEFLETKYSQRCHINNHKFYSKWSKNMDYQNWYIINLIGNGAFAKVFLVKHKEIDENGEC